jgi:predicted Zn-dependent protease
MEEESKLATETLAELYLKGENVEKAYQIYRELLKQNPDSSRYKDKVRELELRLNASKRDRQRREESSQPTGEIDRTIGELKEWLNRIQRTRKKRE